MNRTWLYWTGLSGAFLAGFGTAAAASQPDNKTVTRTVTEEVPIEVASESCLRAVERAKHNFLVVSEVLGAASEGYAAVSREDPAGMEAATSKMDEAEKQLDPEGFLSAADQCETESETESE